MNSWKKKLITIWSGQAFSLLTSAIVQFAIIWWLTKTTGSAKVLAFASIAGIVPQIILGPFIGVYVDRWNRKVVMLLADSFIALCSLIIGILYWTNNIEIWHIYVLLALRSVGSGFHFPAMQASIPLLAPQEQLSRIAGVNQVLYSVSNIAGPALGALLIMKFNMGIIMLLDVAGAFIACSTLLFVSIPRPEPSQSDVGGKNLIREMKVAFLVLWKDKGLAFLLTGFMIFSLVFMPVNALFPLMTVSHFNGGAVEMSLVEVTFGFGMLAGGGLLAIWKGPKRKIILINIAYILTGVTLLLSGLLPSTGFTYFVILVGFFGASVPLYNGPFTVIMQTKVEPAMLGRVFSLIDTLSLLPAPIGLLSTGFIADNIGIANSFAISGLIITAIGIASFFIPALMKIEEKKEAVI